MITAENYRQTQIMTASPMELIIMLYDEAIRSLATAEDAFKNDQPDRIPEINNNLLKAQNIITELTVSLDMEKGGAIATNLQRLYDFMSRHLSIANVSKSARPIKEVREMMGELRDAWKEVAEKEPKSDHQEEAVAQSNISIEG